LGITLVAISAESPAASKVMQDRKNAPFLFVADENLELIDAFGIRDGNIAKPGFILLHQGKNVWQHSEFKFLRQNMIAIIEKIKKVQHRINSNKPGETASYE